MENQHGETGETDFQRIFRKLPGLFLILARDDYEIVDASDAYLKATRHEREEIVGQKLFEGASSIKGPQAESMRQLHASLEKVKNEKRHDTMAILPHPIHKPGKENNFETRWWSPVNAPIFNSKGEVEYIVHRIEDITPIIHQMQGEDNTLLQDLEAEEAHLTADILLRGRDLQKEKEKAIENLRESEAKYRTLFESIDEGFCILEKSKGPRDKVPDFRFIEANPGFEIQSGLEDPVGKTLLEVVPEIEKAILKVLDNVVETGKPLRYENYISSLDMWISAYIFRFDISGPNRLGILFKNITERKKVEEAMRNSKDKYQTLFESIDAGFFISKVLFDENGQADNLRFLETNPSFESQSGIENAEGKYVSQIIPELEDTWFEIYGNVALNREPIRFEEAAESLGRIFDVYAFPIGQPKEHKVAALFSDITERKHREQRDKFLLKLNDTLRSFSDSNQIRSKAIELLQEQLNTNRSLFIEATTDGDQFVVKNNITNGVPSIEGDIDLYDFGSSLVDTLQAGKTYIERDTQKDPELKNDEKESFQQIHVRSKIAVPLLIDGKLTVILAVEKAEPYDWSDHEIALVEETAERTWAYIERLRAEEKLIALKNNLEDRVRERTTALQSYQNQLRSLASRLNKAEQKEQNRLAAELHDNLGQLLTLCKIKVQDIKKNANLNDVTSEVNELFELIDDALTYTRELTSDLKPPPSLSKEDFNEILDWIIKKMKKHGLQVTVEDDDQPKPLNEEVRTTLHQSVKELLFNIVKHSGVKEAYITISREDEMIKVTIEDHGKGFNMEGEEPVPTDEGGFGLFNVRERMNFLGGKLELSSEPGSGTKAVLFAPIKKKKSSKVAQKEAQEPPLVEENAAPAELQQKIKILLVDDHEMVRRGLRNLIEEQDDMAIIAEAANGKEAVELAQQTHPDVVVMDVNMPVMDGIESTQRITSQLPDIHIIGLSFYNEEDVARNMRDAGATAYMSKDEAFEALCATIRGEATTTLKE